MSLVPISKTKIIPPRRRAELFTRKRLVDTMFESLDKKLTLVSAPAGYGKTSLLIDFTTQTELPCCWLALDELDRDPQRFIAYLIASLAERFPTFGNQSTSVLGSLRSLEQDMERMLVTLVNETYEQIHEHFILVLDDFHLVEDVQSIQAFMNRFIQLVDENCHVIISSRILISLPDLSLLVAREQVSGLSFSDLAFHADEIQAMLAQNNNLRISDADAQKMIDKTEGWITGLQFSGMGGDVLKSVSGTGVGLFDFLGQQVLERQAPAMQDFLLRTSVLEEFDASLCQAVLSSLYPEPQNWHSWISAVVQNNLFVLPVGTDGRWLRYHHLFRDFLSARLEQLHPQEVRPILYRLGQAYEDLAEWEKAHFIYKKLDDKEALAQMIERAGFAMIRRALLTVESWLNDLPPSFLRTHAELLSIRGTIAYMKGDLREGLNLLNQSERIFREADGNLAGLTMALVRRSTAYRFLGDYAASLKDADEVIQLTEASDDLQLVYAEALRMKGLALYRIGHANQAVEVLEKSSELFVHMNEKLSIPVLLMETGVVYQAIGNYVEAGLVYEKALQVWQKEGNLSWQANSLNNLGVLRQLQGQYEKASMAFEEGLICAQRSGNARMEALIAIGLGDLSTELEDFDVAQLNYRHAEEMISEKEDRFLVYYLAMAKVNMALLKNRTAETQQLLRDAAGLIQSSDSLFEQGLLNFILGRLSLLDRKPSQAIAQLEEAERCFSEDGRKMESAANCIWLAAAHYQLKNHKVARQLIESVLDSRGQVSHGILIAVHQARSWLDGLQRDAELGRVTGDLLMRADRMAAKMPATRRHLHRTAHVVQIPNPHLIIRAFGQASVSVGGKLLTVSDWQTQAVRDLFFYFLISQKPLTREQVGEVLWPDLDDPQKIKLRFKNYIYRLRRAVGQDVISYEDVYYSFNRGLDFEYDVEAFESFLSRAKTTRGIEAQIELYQKTVDLVGGPFLEDIYSDWVMYERERLSQLYLSALLTLAELLQKQARPEQALAICQRALDYELTFEAAYSLSMQIYHRMGDRASIIRTYQVCQDTLQRQLGLPPSNDTDQLYQRLITSA